MQKIDYVVSYEETEMNGIDGADSDENEWINAQLPIFEWLVSIIPGGVIRFYNEASDGLVGPYISVCVGHFVLEIDIEDARSLEEYDNRRVVDIKVFHPVLNEQCHIADEDTWVVNNGFVETMEEAAIIVKCLESNQFPMAMMKLFHLQCGIMNKGNFKQPRTKENLTRLVKKSYYKSVSSAYEL